jgi:outer membrane protein assembly factor BamB
MDGTVAWNQNVLKEFDAPNLFFGTSASPMLVGDLLLVMVGGKGASVVAFDATSGTKRWASQDDRASYASPYLFERGSERQAIFLTQQGLLALNPSSGAALWRLPLVTFNDENACTPIGFGDLVIATSVSYGGVAMKVTGSEATLAWQTKAFSSYFSSPVLLGNELYAVTGTPAALKCIDAASGKELWTHPSVGLLFASLLVAKDRLLIQTDTGLLLLAEPSREGYKQVAKAQACGPGWIQPALANGHLFVRDKTTMKALQVGQ